MGIKKHLIFVACYAGLIVALLGLQKISCFDAAFLAVHAAVIFALLNGSVK